MAATDHARSIKQDSQDYLTTALLQILETKQLNEIKITEVVKRAGVSRMAFYRNFQTLDDLLTAYFEPLISNKFKDLNQGLSSEEKLTKLDEFFSSMADTMVLAHDQGFEYIIQNIFNDNMKEFYISLPQAKNLSATKRKYWTSFMSAGVYSIWQDWLLDEQSESLDEIHDIIALLQNSTMKAIINSYK